MMEWVKLFRFRRIESLPHRKTCNCKFAFIKREVAQAGSAPGLGPGGRRFESCLPDINKKSLEEIQGFFIHYATYVYILKSLRDAKYYIGETINVQQRLAFHNTGLQRSTCNRTPFEFLLFKTFANRILTLQREKQIKGWKGVNAFSKLVAGK